MPAWTWHSPSQMCMFSRPSWRCTWAPRNWSGQNSTSRVGGDRGDDLDGVRRRAADVGLGLHRGGRVDVADDDGAGVLGLPRPQLVGGDRLGEAAAGPLVGDQHRLVVAQDLRRLGHEVDAAEHDRRRLGLGRDPGQPERVADVVGDVLDLRQLVVVGQDHGVALGGQRTHLLGPVVGKGLHDIQRTNHPSVWRAASARRTLGWLQTLGWIAPSSWARRTVLTEPLAPIGWAKRETRSSSSFQRHVSSEVSSSAPPAGRPRPSAGRSRATSSARRSRRYSMPARSGGRRAGAGARARRRTVAATSRSRCARHRRPTRRSAGAPAGRAGPARGRDGRGRRRRRPAHRRRSPARPLAHQQLQRDEGRLVPRQRRRASVSTRSTGRRLRQSGRRALPTARADSGTVSSSSRRTPPRITRRCSSGLVSTRSDTLSPSSSSAG